MSTSFARAAYAAVTERPGKFQNEAAYVPYFWEAYLNGFADDDDGETLTFNVTPEDVRIFPELTDRRVVCLTETNDGFVVEVG